MSDTGTRPEWWASHPTDRDALEYRAIRYVEHDGQTVSECLDGHGNWVEVVEGETIPPFLVVPGQVLGALGLDGPFQASIRGTYRPWSIPGIWHPREYDDE